MIRRESLFLSHLCVVIPTKEESAPLDTRRSRYDFFVYIVASPSRTIYIGFTENLERRIWQHRNKTYSGFSAKYGTTRLVYFEMYPRVDDAFAREKQIKGWSLPRKLALINAENPKWWDLSRDWEI
jgi:putative endonuclease